ncbi:MAG: 23S rRNA (pseudouridine(1915)-N(3))-methyltransferase RlmH [Methylococcaceae bacterium]|nr:23S rRNA (pseudouridine(1915)-N(3))-methyltransferase RlmH [Methylococcaceae bacterium]
MNIHIIAVGHRMPAWVQQGFQEYAKRMCGECRVRLLEVAVRRRSREVQQTIRIEGELMLKAIPAGGHVVALDVDGCQWSTEGLAEMLAKWMAMGKDIALLIGGPEGLAPECRAAAKQTWGLSKLTFPHPLVRIIVIEQLYRAWSLLRNHPYHRQ